MRIKCLRLDTNSCRFYKDTIFQMKYSLITISKINLSSIILRKLFVGIVAETRNDIIILRNNYTLNLYY